jgi:hypothetical protein
MSRDRRPQKASTLSETTSSMAVGFLEEKALCGKQIEVPSLGVSFSKSDLIQNSDINESDLVVPEYAQ